MEIFFFFKIYIASLLLHSREYTDYFGTQRGVRQGFQLSLFLFALAIKPLAKLSRPCIDLKIKVWVLALWEKTQAQEKSSTESLTFFNYTNFYCVGGYIPSLQMQASKFLRVFWRKHGWADLCVTTAWNFGPVRVPLALLGHQLQRQQPFKCVIRSK